MTDEMILESHICVCGKSDVQGYTTLFKAWQPGVGDHFRCLDCVWKQLRIVEDLRLNKNV